MTMTLAKAAKNSFTILVAAFFFAPLLGAQAPAKKPHHKSKAAAAAQSAPAPSADAPAAKPTPAAGRRDPFLPLVNEQTNAAGNLHLPPGKAGLVVASVHVDGTVSSPNGMIAVVSNPEQRVYFIREGDHLYDGTVEKIGLDGVTFRETSKDAFGKPVERVVTKRIYASAGEQQ